MGALKSLIRIISSMTSEERDVARSYLRYFDQRGKRTAKRGKLFKTKSLILFDFLAEKKNQMIDDEAEIEHLVYGKAQKPGTFPRLLLRLKNKITESLILDINISREGAYNEKSKATVEVRKRITVAQILEDRGIREQAKAVFESAIKLAQKFELFEELLLALRFLSSHISMNGNHKQVDELLKQYAFYEECKNAVVRAEVKHGFIVSKVDYFADQNLDLKELKTIMDTIGNDYIKTRSAQVGYYYFYIETQYCQSQGYYKNARKALNDLISLLDSKPAIYTSMRKGGAMLNLADNDLYLHEFKHCYQTAEEAITYFKAGSFNYCQGIELMFLSLFYLGQYEEALKTINRIIPENTVEMEFRLGKRLFLKSSCLFMLKRYNEAGIILNMLNPIEQDKEGWNMSIRILTIMCQLELGLHDEAATKIEALSTFMADNKKRKFSDRVKLIYSILLKFKSPKFDYLKIYQKEQSKISDLSKTVDTYSWSVKSPELVIFHQWFFAKTIKQDWKMEIPNPPNIVKLIHRRVSAS